VNTTMANLAYKLSRELERPVTDRTNLSGNYDFLLSWTPDAGPCAMPLSGPNAAVEAGEANGPSLFTALREQLGLKLESKKGPVEVLAINHVEQPTAN
jgi:uncharacterized protein (TIGR03435 family)